MDGREKALSHFGILGMKWKRKKSKHKYTTEEYQKKGFRTIKKRGVRAGLELNKVVVNDGAGVARDVLERIGKKPYLSITKARDRSLMRDRILRLLDPNS